MKKLLLITILSLFIFGSVIAGVPVSVNKALIVTADAAVDADVLLSTQARDTLNARTSYLGIPGAQIDSMNTPDGSVTAWIAGASHRMFTITNSVYIHAVYGVVRETLTELAAACTIELGVVGATAGLIATTDPPTTLAAGDVWTNSGTASLVPLGTPSDAVIIPFTTDIDMTVGGVGGVDDVNDGIISIIVVWSPAPPLIGGGAGTLAPAVWD